MTHQNMPQSPQNTHTSFVPNKIIGNLHVKRREKGRERKRERERKFDRRRRRSKEEKET